MTIPVNRNLCGANSFWAVEVDVPFHPENTVASAPGGGAVLNYPPIPGVKYRIGGLTWSHPPPSPGMPVAPVILTITLNPGGIVYRIHANGLPINMIVFKPPQSAPPGVGMTIAISPGAAGAVSLLNATVWAYLSSGYSNTV